ncbi:YciC family protein [Amycolatopsis albispora]|uniref:YciC family protein n=1 Tax=Amycolatopsis albispora TaxID=1804986 RepID=UPI000DE428C5|nr:YciC family protein [Amycolatopsis albispora]
MSDTNGWATPGGPPPQHQPHGGWPPPPQPGPRWNPDGYGRPGVIPLRPLNIGEILDGAFTTVRRNPAIMLGVSLVVVLITQFVGYLVSLPLLDDLNRASEATNRVLTEQQALDLATDLLTSSGLVAVVSGVVSALGTSFLDGFLTVVVGKAILGRKPTFGEAMKEAAPRLVPLLGLTILYTLMIFVGLLLCIVPGIYVGVVFGLATPALVLEKAGIGTAFKRSSLLVKDAFWRVLGVLLLAMVIAWVITQVVSLPFSLAGDFSGFTTLFSGEVPEYTEFGLAIATLGTVVALTFTAPFSAGVRALVYIDQRMRKEGMDFQLARAAAAPAAPPAGSTDPTPPSGIPMGQVTPEQPEPPKESSGEDKPKEDPEPPRPS